MGVAEFYYLEGGLFFGFLVAAGLTLISLSRPAYGVARRCAWAASILFGSIAVVWGITTPESAWIRIPAIGLVGLVTAICLTEALRFIKERESPKAPEAVSVATPARGPTLEATRGSMIDATGAVIPGDLPFQFGKADNNSVINMPGTVVTRREDGTILVEYSKIPVDRKFPPPNGKYSKLSKQDLKAAVLKTSTDLRAVDRKQGAELDLLNAKFSNDGFRNNNNNPPGFHEGWSAIVEKFRPENERLAKQSQSLASECMVRIGTLQVAELSLGARLGSESVFQGKPLGGRPAFAAEFLEALSSRLN